MDGWIYVRVTCFFLYEDKEVSYCDLQVDGLIGTKKISFLDRSLIVFVSLLAGGRLIIYL